MGSFSPHTGRGVQEASCGFAHGKGAWVAACGGDHVVDEVAVHELEVDMYSATSKKIDTSKELIGAEHGQGKGRESPSR